MLLTYFAELCALVDAAGRMFGRIISFHSD